MLRRVGALCLVLLTACASTTRFTPQRLAPSITPETRFYEEVLLEPHVGRERPVPVEARAFQEALQRLAHAVRVEASPREAARALMGTRMELEGEWFAEVVRGRTVLAPLVNCKAAANRIAKEWGPDKLTPPEQDAINDALAQGQPFQANRLEGQARGRWVEAQMRELFKCLKWNPHGVDVTGPSGQEYHYELLAGTEDNFGRHGRRMFDIFFRMIFF